MYSPKNPKSRSRLNSLLTMLRSTNCRALDELIRARLALILVCPNPMFHFGGVADDVHVAVGKHLGVVAGEPQLDGVDQFRGVDIPVEPQAEAFDAGVGLREREVVVEREGQQVLHAEAHGELETVVLGAEGDTLSDLDVGHVAQLCEEFAGGVGLKEVTGGRLRAGSGGSRAEEEQKQRRKKDVRQFFHRGIFLLVCRFGREQMYKKIGESRIS